ncbi:MAG: hypothetical protein DMF84_01205 [Acidobacteria bacterium]|nr:MAG: hypothetical protein DMF84_01205 [Acidobacteriota bacterium]
MDDPFDPWPKGRRVVMDEHGIVEDLPTDAAVPWWVCCRLDEPWTFTLYFDQSQHVTRCCDCQAEIVYRVTARSPTNSDAQKICRRCATRRLHDDTRD